MVKVFGMTLFESPFEAEFGFKREHPAERGDSESYAVIGERKAAWQNVVDLRLTALASTYDRVDRSQRSLLSRAKGAKSSSDGCNYLSMERDAARSVEEARKSFWQAHGLAKQAGFSVKEKYTNYLPSPWL